MEALKEADEAVREDMWLDQVYGVKSMLENKEWIEKVSNEGSWALNARGLRRHVMEAAGVEVVHDV